VLGPAGPVGIPVPGPLGPGAVVGDLLSGGLFRLGSGGEEDGAEDGLEDAPPNCVLAGVRLPLDPLPPLVAGVGNEVAGVAL
jgi:hypothetical protein